MNKVFDCYHPSFSLTSMTLDELQEHLQQRGFAMTSHARWLIDSLEPYEAMRICQCAIRRIK